MALPRVCGARTPRNSSPKQRISSDTPCGRPWKLPSRRATEAGDLKRRLLYLALLLALLGVAGWAMHRANRATPGSAAARTERSRRGGLRSFEIVPLETVSETSSNASIGDLDGDGHPDVVLVKGRHWQVPSLVLLGDGRGHFTPGPPLPSGSTKSYSAALADMIGSGHL